MKTVKMFDANEIEEATGIDVLDIYWGNFCNDTAIPWHIDEEDNFNEDYEKIDNYFMAHGAVLGEKVWIDVTW